MLDKINFNYDENSFDWVNSKIYYFLCDHYGLNNIIMTLNNNQEIFVEKYNVIGNVDGEKYITIYNNIGELIPLHVVDLNNICSCEIVK